MLKQNYSDITKSILAEKQYKYSSDICVVHPHPLQIRLHYQMSIKTVVLSLITLYSNYLILQQNYSDITKSILAEKQYKYSSDICVVCHHSLFLQYSTQVLFFIQEN